MKLKNVASSTVALAIALTLSGCGPESPGDLRDKLEDAGAEDCDEPEQEEGEGWVGVQFDCELAHVLSSTGASGVTVTTFEDSGSVDAYVHDKNAWVRDPYVVGKNWIAHNSSYEHGEDSTGFVKDTLGGEIRAGEPQP
ncbi:hypothetical protein [Brevibacterium sp. FAM 24630]|uniref:hypothetical protein n=1 Tax=Brevibacterium sp. FAM 24630 TaxID=3415680 RepID=UPI003C7C74A5